MNLSKCVMREQKSSLLFLRFLIAYDENAEQLVMPLLRIRITKSCVFDISNVYTYEKENRKGVISYVSH